MKKLDYSDEKLQEITRMLTDLGIAYRCEPDCIDITITTNAVYRSVQHQLYTIFYMHPKPPLSQQFDHSTGVMSLFDPRQR